MFARDGAGVNALAGDHPNVKPIVWRCGCAILMIAGMVRRRSLLFALLAVAAAWSGAARAADRPLIVVELFTSQGCSSCPPADAYLGKLAERDDLLPLAFHVDYWDYIGWHDPFAMPVATHRQRAYARRLNLRYVYTPQMVINGVAQGIGSEPAEIEPLIKAQAAGMEGRPRPPLSLQRQADGGLAIRVGGGAVLEGEPCTVWLIRFDRSHSTPVAHGENGGRTLVDYQVVRSIRDVGHWFGSSLDLAIPPADGGEPGDGLAVLLQAGSAGPILNAVQVKPPAS
jgi:hypothetical protein